MFILNICVYTNSVYTKYYCKNFVSQNYRNYLIHCSSNYRQQTLESLRQFDKNSYSYDPTRSTKSDSQDMAWSLGIYALNCWYSESSQLLVKELLRRFSHAEPYRTTCYILFLSSAKLTNKQNLLLNNDFLFTVIKTNTLIYGP